MVGKMIDKNNNVVLLLTGCVTPNCNDNLVVKDVDVRKEMYVRAIDWYLKNTNYKVVFCENSGTDLSDLFNSERAEFITYVSGKDGMDRSKGYKEMEILEHACRQSRFVRESDEDSIFVKVTGRLVLLNVVEIVSRLQRRRKTGRRFVSAYLNGRKPFCSCEFIFFSPSFLPQFVGMKEKIYQHYNFEHVTTEAVLSSYLSGYQCVYPPPTAEC